MNNKYWSFEIGEEDWSFEVREEDWSLIWC